MDWHSLCDITDLDDPGSRGFEVDAGGGHPVRLFIVRKAGNLRAYLNRCPHTGAPLEWTPHQFLDIDKSFIQCALHGALFRPEDGVCLRGPCVGDALQSLTLRVSGGVVSVALPAAGQSAIR